MNFDPAQVAFVDIETTGLDPETDHIWEIAAIVDGEEHVWQQRLPGDNWQAGVTDWVLENTRITTDYNHDTAVPPLQSIYRFADLVQGRHLAGACPWFDSERLHRLILGSSVADRSLPWHYHLIDVENLAVGYLAGANAFGDGGNEDTGWGIWNKLPWRSTDLSLALGVDRADFEPEHSALADAHWAKALYEKITG